MIEHEKQQLLELKHRIEFLRNDVDPDILIGAIERELAFLKMAFRCVYAPNLYRNHWKYSMHFSNFSRKIIKHSKEHVTADYKETKLDALYEALKDLTRE